VPSLLAMLITAGLAAAATWTALLLLPWTSGPLTRRTRAFRGEREESPVVRLGGVCVVAGALAGTVAGLNASHWSGSLGGASQYHWIGWIGGCAALFACGLYDDLYGLGARVKLACQGSGAVVVFLAGFRVESIALPGLGRFDLGLAALPLTVLWIVAVTNAINLIDGLDGLASGLCLMASATIAAVALAQGVFPVALVGLALSGALLGFLPFNLHPARFHLGDCGSQVIGFTLGVLALRGFQKSSTAVTLLAPVLILGVPLCDTALVILRRLWRGRNGSGAVPGSILRARGWRAVFERDREHVHYNLLDLGLSERRAVGVLYVTAAALCASALVLVFRSSSVPALVTAIAVLVEIVVLKVWAGFRRGAVPPRSAASGEPIEGAATGPVPR